MSDERALHVDDVANAVVGSVTRVGGVACMSSRGRGRSAALLGSVATEITTRAKRPVIIVGPAFHPEAWAADARVLACVDGTAASESVIPTALAWARALTVSLSFVTVAEPIPTPVAGRQWRRTHGPDENAESYMDALLERHRTDRVPIDGTVVYDSVSVAGGLVDHVARHPPSLIAVATRARTGVPRLLLGSTAAAILREVPVPVLAVAVAGER
jgi:nucleotide-binding universal stress UspA family protein